MLQWKHTNHLGLFRMSKKTNLTRKTNQSHKASQKPTLPIIGPSAYVSVAHREQVPAKIDTGAEASSIWASNIKVGKDGMLKFSLFGPSSPFYNGKFIKRKDYTVMVVRSAMGHEQLRYRVHLPIKISGRKINVLFSLSNRSRNSFPILIGRRTLQGKFIVDVSLPDVEFELKPKQKLDLKQFNKDPYKFHKTYMRNQN